MAVYGEQTGLLIPSNLSVIDGVLDYIAIFNYTFLSDMCNRLAIEPLPPVKSSPALKSLHMQQ